MNDDFKRRKKNLGILSTKEEMKEQQKQAYKDLIEINEEIKIKRKKKLKKIFQILLIFILYFKAFVGVVYIKNPFGLNSNKIRYYDFTINGKIAGHDVSIVEKKPIIPFFIYIKSDTGRYFENEEKSLGYIGNDDKYILDLKLFTCYSEKHGYKYECTYKKSNMIEEKDFKITKLTIWNSENNKVIYEGKWKKDITNIIKDANTVNIKIKIKYDNISSTITSRITKKDYFN
jgi:hypothetical protein